MNLSAYYNRTGDRGEGARVRAQGDGARSEIRSRVVPEGTRRGAPGATSTAAVDVAEPGHRPQSARVLLLLRPRRRVPPARHGRTRARRPSRSFKRLEQESARARQDAPRRAAAAAAAATPEPREPARSARPVAARVPADAGSARRGALLPGRVTRPPSPATLAGRRRSRTSPPPPACCAPERLRQPRRQAVPARGDGLRRGVLRLRQRRLARHLPRQRHAASTPRSRDRQPTSYLFHNNRDGTFTDVTAKAGLTHSGWGQALLRRRLRQRRLRRSVRHVLGPATSCTTTTATARSPTSPRRPAWPARRRGGAPAAAFSTTTATGISICSSPTT